MSSAPPPFYECLQRGDIETLMSLWSDDDEIVCVHPGGRRLVGLAQIRTAFELMFANGCLNIRPDHVRRVQTLTTAVHSVLETVGLGSGDKPRVGYVLATNVYVKTPQGWRMVCHHATPGTMGETQDTAQGPTTLH
jgi:ketosteroid isomerase-like protein